MADLTHLVDTRDCITPGCPNEADGRDGLCRMCRQVPSRRTLLAPTPTHQGALAHLMTDDDPAKPDEEPAMPTPPPVPLPRPDQPATSVATCRLCDSPATHLAPRGMYARLCDTHYEQQRARASRPRAAKPPASVKAPQTASAPRPATPPPSETTTPAPGMAEAGTSPLVELAHAVDDARHRLERAKGDLDAALQRLNAAVQEIAA